MKRPLVVIAILTCCSLFVGPARASTPVAELIAAARVGDVQRIDALLSDNADLINATDARGRTPLHAAADALSVSAADRLIDAGADVNARNRDGAAPLHLAALTTTTAHRAAASRAAMTKLLIQKGADAGAADAQALQPLHLAALKGRDEMLSLLTAAGARTDAKDRLGRTPLHHAAMGNHKGTIAWLIDHGADVNAPDATGNTPLHSAALRFRENATRLLIAKGANVNAANAEGKTPLHTAAGAGPEAPEVERLLIGVVRELLDAGADATAKDKSNNTARDYALQKQRHQLVQMLP